ncbi:HNH endonuclease [Acidithiobacillus sp. CV18-2]|uniref:HNH endonuclease n=1 Tax=Igneacidithiobacillus copahuensis TaxID=2724909 RepID=A0AAE2YP43_9PROT|nr:HNH endonuclease [Igneacidithiobacillus copahuensis]MBU2755389.1 HNH endonuclease [Acidithiobacillus sp. CV18-3]MBU2757867.1 HNH endonuclease [Acidithiobacillus sp. BN09-2]MBU2776673.1 HNH endonuclease [Acidithiobacillus sp. CV18-2]MBU2797595.1 HNH endonuclease [Acidithiobacillus sp. VAN18-2]MBU2798672.1 HNH endonuclease [Acidithiobacillus sp. VAN18-4]UTV80770.1 HNH endonuclease [Acidithiobacillus sp. YTS05]
MHLVLRLDVSGRPMAWETWEEAAAHYARGNVAWTLGDPFFTAHGGTSRHSGEISLLDIHPLIAVRGRHQGKIRPPALNNPTLFHRDRHLCLYCGGSFPQRDLTRDHVVPLSRKGRDVWTNVVTACRWCNSRKDNRTPEEANMPLLAVPFTPTWAEYLLLSNRRILADQMEFLLAQVPVSRQHVF